MQENLFVTGFLRSGTTLLEKCLHMRGNICVAPQPMPLLFVDVKRAFLKRSGVLVPRYPLGHLFQEGKTFEDFLEYLDSAEISSSNIRKSLGSMRDYSGCYLPEIIEADLPESPGSFFEWYRLLVMKAANILGCDDRPVIGSKEVFCEEYLPYFCKQRIFSLLIIRDPRAVANSVKGDKGAHYVDSAMDLLHVVRQWRKSVAIYLALIDEPRFKMVLFENLVHSPNEILDDVDEWLGLESRSSGKIDLSSMRDQFGKPWGGNSSFATGSEKPDLPCELRSLVEALCAPEMRLLGYEADGAGTNLSPDDVESMAISAGIRENDAMLESERLRRLQSDIAGEGVLEWFVSHEAYGKLKAVMNNG